MSREALIGTIAIAAVVLGIVIVLGGTGGSPVARPSSSGASIDEPRVHGGGGSLGSGTGDRAPQRASDEVSRDLAARLARALDGGAMRPIDVPEPDPIAPGHSAALVPPQPQLRFDHPLTAAEQLDYAARLYDYIVLRRDDLRHQLEELERAGDGESDPATRIRRELTRLESAEPNARHRVDELAARARTEALEPEARDPSPVEGI